MSSMPRGGVRILGSLRSAGGLGSVRMEDRFEAEIEDVWQALTERERLARWYGAIDGDLRVGGRLRARVHASGWEGTIRVEDCEAPRRLLVVSKEDEDPNEDSTEVVLRDDGAETVMVVEQRGLPLEFLWAYAAGLQIHVEDLGAHVAGSERGDTGGRFDALAPVYRDLAAGVSDSGR